MPYPPMYRPPFIGCCGAVSKRIPRNGWTRCTRRGSRSTRRVRRARPRIHLRRAGAGRSSRRRRCFRSQAWWRLPICWERNRRRTRRQRPTSKRLLLLLAALAHRRFSIALRVPPLPSPPMAGAWSSPAWPATRRSCTYDRSMHARRARLPARPARKHPSCHPITNGSDSSPTEFYAKSRSAAGRSWRFAI